MLDDSTSELGTFHSIVKRMNGFLYRCRNDKNYTMLFMAGEVARLTGYEPVAFTGPEQRSYSAQTHPEDLQAVYDAVDGALAVKGNWQIHYRIVRPDGSAIWVQEVGGGVWNGDKLVYLEGAVIDVDRSRTLELRNMEMRDAISDKARLLLGNTVPIVEVLRTLRILAINARLEAGRAGPLGASFGFVANEVSRLAEETSVLAEKIADVTGQLQELLKAG
jgi:hypothetical protein